MQRPRILLADDHTLLLDGMCKLLENDFTLIGTVSNGRELLAEAERLMPDVILLDISMPLLNGLDAARQLKQRGVRAKLVFVTMHNGTDYVQEAFRAGASAYVLKQAAAAELVGAVHEVLRGNSYISPTVNKDVLATLNSARQPVSGRGSGELTMRQREVLQLVAEGHAAKSVADLLHISQKTVEFHKASMMRQLGLRSSAELIRYAINHGLVEKQ
jgi:DNA-binding NarL/FixJ family response regulator